MPAAGRRLFIAVSVRTYQHPRWPRLGSAQLDATAVAALFTELGFDHQLPDLVRAKGRQQILDALGPWFGSLEGTGDDTVVLYWSGHGAARPAPDGEGLAHYLIASDTDEPSAEQAIPANLLGRLLAGSKVRQSLVILDTCHSGAGSAEIAETLARQTAAEQDLPLQRSGMVVMAAARPLQEAWVRGLAPALVTAVRANPRCGAYDDQFIRLDVLHDVLNAELRGRGQRVESNVARLGSELRLVPNPRWGRGPVADDRAMTDHFGPLGRGVQTARQAGQFFTDRTSALQDLARWIDPGNPASSGLRVVTGPPGCGKSGLVARMVTMSLERGDGGPPPLADAVSAALPLESATVESVIDSLDRLLGLRVPAPRDASMLASRLAELGAFRPTTLVLDGLDEAEAGNPLPIADLLVDLAERPGVRVLVATRDVSRRRADGAEEPLLEVLRAKPEQVMDLAEDRWKEPGAMAGYVERRLLGAENSYCRDQPVLARRLGELVAGSVGDQYHLAAFVVAGILRSRPRERDLAGLRFPDSIEWAVQDDFERFGDDPTIPDLLGALSRAEGEGFPLELWAAAAGAYGTAVRPEELRARLPEFEEYLRVTTVAGEAQFRLFHRAFVEALGRPDPDAAVDDAVVAAVTTDGARDWQRAGSYARSHLLIHARRAGRLEELCGDPDYLLRADPPAVLTALGPAAQGPTWGDPLRDVARGYLWAGRLLEPLATPDRAAYLELAARLVTGNRELAEQYAARSGSWRCVAARPNPVPPHRSIPVTGSGFSLRTATLDGRAVALSSGPVVQVVDLESGRRLHQVSRPGYEYVGGRVGLLDDGVFNRCVIASVHAGRESWPGTPMTHSDLFAQSIDELVVLPFREQRREVVSFAFRRSQDARALPGMPEAAAEQELGKAGMFLFGVRTSDFATVDNRFYVAALAEATPAEAAQLPPGWHLPGRLVLDNRGGETSFLPSEGDPIVAVAAASHRDELVVLEGHRSGSVWLRGPQGQLTVRVPAVSAVDVAVAADTVVAAAAGGAAVVLVAVGPDGGHRWELPCPAGVDSVRIGVTRPSLSTLVAVACGGHARVWQVAEDFTGVWPLDAPLTTGRDDVNDVAWWCDQDDNAVLVAAASAALRGRAEPGRHPARPAPGTTGWLYLWDATEIRDAATVVRVRRNLEARGTARAAPAAVRVAPMPQAPDTGAASVLAASADGTLTRVDPGSDQTTTLPRFPFGDQLSALDALWTGAAALVALGGRDGTVVLANLASGEYVAAPADGDPVLSVALASDGTWVRMWTVQARAGLRMVEARLDAIDRVTGRSLPAEVVARLPGGLGMMQVDRSTGTAAAAAPVSRRLTAARTGHIGQQYAVAVAGFGGITLWGEYVLASYETDFLVRDAIPLGDRVVFSTLREVCLAPVDERLQLAQATRRHQFRARCLAAARVGDDVLVAAGSDDGAVLLAREQGDDAIVLQLQDLVEDLCILPGGMVVASAPSGLLWLAPFGGSPAGGGAAG